MKTFRAELHTHTVLSPCAGVEMIPPLIVQQAINLGINLIAITDHNATENVSAVIEAAEDKELVVLPGIELQTQEDVHVICLFDNLEQLSRFQFIVDQNLPDIKNNIEFFGEQFIVDSTGEFISRKDQLLITASNLSFDKAFEIVNDLEGLFIPAHVNRQTFGLFYHLGFIPLNLDLSAIEISRHISPEEAKINYPQLKNYPLIQSGDVHYLDDFLGVNQFTIKDASIAEIKMALKSENGRHFSLLKEF